MIDLAIVLLILIGVVSIIDWKFKQVPSFFLTTMLFITLMIHFYDFEIGLISLSIGSLAFLYAWTLYELEFIGGIADVKIITLIGMMMINIPMFFTLMILVVLFGTAYKLFFRYVLDREKDEEIPFIPCLYAIYIVFFLIGGVA